MDKYSNIAEFYDHMLICLSNAINGEEVDARRVLGSFKSVLKS